MTHKLIGVNELAEALSVPISWIYSRTRIKGAGQVPHIRCGKYVRFDIDEVMDWLQKKGETAMNNIIPFEYESHDIRVVTDDTGDPWWVAKDICGVLGLGNTSQALSYLDDDEQTVITDDSLTSSRNPNVSIINESGLYSLILSNGHSTHIRGTSPRRGHLTGGLILVRP